MQITRLLCPACGEPIVHRFYLGWPFRSWECAACKRYLRLERASFFVALVASVAPAVMVDAFLELLGVEHRIFELVTPLVAVVGLFLVFPRIATVEVDSRNPTAPGNRG